MLRLTPFALAVGLFVAGTSFVHAGLLPEPDLYVGGLWEGELRCRGLDAESGQFSNVRTNVFLAVYQDEFGVLSTEAAFDEGFLMDFLPMCGQVVADPARENRGRATLLGLYPGVETLVVAPEFPVVRIFNPNGNGVSGRMRGEGPMSVIGYPLSGRCRWKLRRVESVVPLGQPIDSSCTGAFLR